MSYKAPKQHDLQALTRLGLTLCQAKVYLALTQLGISTIKAISKVAEVSRPDIYRIMDKLHELGLAEKIIDTPIMFKATPIKEAISSLMDNKIEQIQKLQQEAKMLIEKFGAIEAKTTIPESNEFILVPGRKRVTFWLKRATENAQSSIDVVCSKEAFPKALSVMAEVYEKAMNRGVKIRCILEQTKENRPWPKTVTALTERSLFKLRFLPKPPGERSMIFDKKELIVATDTTKGALESSGLWTNNPSILRIANDYYELLWITTMETPSYSIDEKQV